jgi:thioredoxin-like negative regulator of GroEL
MTTHLTIDIEPALVAEKSLFYFSASWCEHCNVFWPIVEKFKKNHPGVMVVKIDTDEKRDLAGLYGVRGIPTVIALEYGAERARHTGLIDDLKLDSMFGF